ncbi:MAG TPA: HPr family phosphocarrier protein [Rhizomicrobium sp.]|nr:HPr family phosphocarrier protein [Rhizomicrobium sp.]HKQ46316.1 HPr family phosphocarrier protein [Rhizomicrobium sp.]HKY17431.1 HPr family phosphocarrier protein [Rhizomicrobium sp.]
MTTLHASATIRNKRGLHARASAKIVEAAARFQSEIHIIKDGTAVNGRSIMGLMMLAASIGSTVMITAEGPDQEEALKAILALVEAKFGEE